MAFHFTQTLKIRRVGFGNTCAAELGVPTPIASELWQGSKLVDFDQHPYIAERGWGNLDGSSYPEQVTSPCYGALVMHYRELSKNQNYAALTRVVMDKDYSTPSFWGLPGNDTLGTVYLSERVTVNSELTEVRFEVDYDTTAHLAFDLSRVAFQWVKLEKDGTQRTLRNVACVPQSNWMNAVDNFRMWGQTYSCNCCGLLCSTPSMRSRH